ncbi:MAG: glycosyltransferase [Chitinivorax sp.]
MTNPAQPLVSVLIRSTGRAELAKALASVSAQTWSNIELLVVNASGSPHPALPRETNGRLITPGNRLSRSEAANRLLAEAKGEFLLFLDEDDWLAPEHCQRLAETLQSSPAYVLAYSGVDCVEKTDSPGHRSVRIYDEEYDPIRLLLENYIPFHAAMFRRTLIESPVNARFDPALDLFEDWDFWLQCQQGGAFTHVPGVSAYYLIQPDHGVGVNIRDEQTAIKAFEQILDKWRNRFTLDQLSAIVVRARHLRDAQQKLTQTNIALEQEKQWAILSQPTMVQELVSANRILSRTNLGLVNRSNKLSQQNLVLQRQTDELQEHNRRLTQSNEELLARLCETETRLDAATRAATRAQSHIQTLDDYIHTIWRSRSWLVTKPLRSAGVGTRKLRSLCYTRLHQIGMNLYRSERTAPLMNLIPATVKRRIHNALLLGSSLPAAPSESSRGGQHVVKSLENIPLVSIIIPVYNHADYILHCIESALNQSWPNTEVIVVNDASPDPKIRQILNGLAHPRLKIFHNDRNLGICATQNRALIASSGEVIAFLDCDDYLADTAIETCMQTWHDDTVYLHSGRINVDEHDREINRINFVSLPRADYFAENLQAMYATHLKLIRRDAFAKVGLFDERFDSAQDYEMLMRIAFHYPSRSFVHVPDFVYHHRLHTGQTTEKQRDKQDRLTSTIQQEARLRMAIRNGDYKRFVSFIMLSYGKHSQTLRAIEGLQATVRIPHEIILYDNGSASETVEFLRQHIDNRFPTVKVIYGDRNLGPAQGRKAALEHASGEWFIIFDNDEVPEPGWLEELLLRAEANENVGAVCCRVVFPDHTLQFSGGQVIDKGDDVIDLALFDKGKRFDELSSCEFRQVDWCPIGATLFTRNIVHYLHEGYPNAFEDAGVSHALKKQGLQLLNAPGALVWHDHITFQPKAEMREQYMRDRYNPKLMLRSLSSFYLENGKIIHDEYVWRENRLDNLSKTELIAKLTAKEMAENKLG